MYYDQITSPASINVKTGTEPMIETFTLILPTDIVPTESVPIFVSTIWKNFEFNRSLSIFLISVTGLKKERCY